MQGKDVQALNQFGNPHGPPSNRHPAGDTVRFDRFGPGTLPADSRTKDQAVPFDQSQRLHAALLQVEVESVLIPIAGGEHGKFEKCVVAPEVAERMRRVGRIRRQKPLRPSG
jgi:hypothetical protein